MQVDKRESEMEIDGMRYRGVTGRTPFLIRVNALLPVVVTGCRCTGRCRRKGEHSKNCSCKRKNAPKGRYDQV